jgi:hypothetical protein
MPSITIATSFLSSIALPDSFALYNRNCVACNILTDIGGSGATFEMVGFQEEFGWRCPGADAPYTDYGDCVAKTVGQVDREKGLINGLFGAGAAM